MSTISVGMISPLAETPQIRIEIEFDYTAVNDNRTGNTIKRASGEPVYPKEDSDCTNIPGTNNCRAKLDIYGYNATDEEAANTSSTYPDQRSSGDCDSDTDCVLSTVYRFLPLF